MQSNILAQVEHLLREKKFNIDIDKFVDFLRLVKHKWIYPDALQRYTHDDIVLIYDALEYLVDSDVLEQSLEIYCPYCNKYVGQHYKTISELPEEVHCPHNDCVISDVAQNAVIVYRVIKDE